MTSGGVILYIYNNYVRQRLFWETGLVTGLIGRSLVVKDRNVHPMLDKAAIKGTSSRISKLINFLGS